MLAVLHGSKAADLIEDADTLEGLVARYAQLSNCVPATDVVMAESEGRLVGYGRTFWGKEGNTDTWLYDHMAYLLPDWRGAAWAAPCCAGWSSGRPQYRRSKAPA